MILLEWDSPTKTKGYGTVPILIYVPVPYIMYFTKQVDFKRSLLCQDCCKCRDCWRFQTVPAHFKQYRHIVQTIPNYQNKMKHYKQSMKQHNKTEETEEN